MTMFPTVLEPTNGVMVQPHDHEHDPAAKPRRRTFTAEKKLALLAEYDAADRDGKGALLRREAIYTSHISEWRKARDRGTLHAPARRRKSAEQVELERLRKRNERLGIGKVARRQVATHDAPLPRRGGRARRQR